MNYKDMLITPNIYSRPKTKQKTIQNIVVHWVGNAGSTAENNAKYFDSLKEGKRNTSGEFIYASSHYIIGNDGVLIRCVPEGEVAYHASSANNYSIGIEVCHPDWGGKFTDLAYKTLINLLGELCSKYRLKPTEAIIRHYDVTKKDCPHYYVQNKSAWDKLKADVEAVLTVDVELEKAVTKIINSGININATSWNNMNKIKLSNVPALLSKLGGIDKLVKDNIISDDKLWSTTSYNTSHVRSLLIKYASKLG